MRALIVSVGYSDLLRLTLPYNRCHFTEVWVVTSSADADAAQPIATANDAKVVVTDLFYENGAEFAKFRAVEYALDAMGREGWICHLDADVCWPKAAGEMLAQMRQPTRCGFLYGATRRMLESPTDLAWAAQNGVPPEGWWKSFHLHPGIGEYAGFTQLYHADDPALRLCSRCSMPRSDHSESGWCNTGKPQRFSWHDVSWRHAGGGDSEFQQRWPRERRQLLPFEVLHIGSAGANWFGRATPTLDGSPLADGAAERIQRTKDLWIERKRTGFSKEKLP